MDTSVSRMSLSTMRSAPAFLIPMAPASMRRYSFACSLATWRKVISRGCFDTSISG
jgi:hypothetical protein